MYISSGSNMAVFRLPVSKMAYRGLRDMISTLFPHRCSLESHCIIILLHQRYDFLWAPFDAPDSNQFSQFSGIFQSSTLGVLLVQRNDAIR
jgi:hypothetical protein